MNKKELKLYGYTIVFSYYKYLDGVYCTFYHTLKIIHVFSNKEMDDQEITRYVRDEVPEFDVAAKKEETRLAEIKNNQCNSKDLAKDPVLIIKDIQQHTASEWNAKTRQKVIGRSGLLIEGDEAPSRIWISNREYQMTTTMQKNILGTVVGTQSSTVIDLLDSDGIVTSKNTRIGRLLSENAFGRYTCKTPNGDISFEIFNRAFFQSTIEGVKGLRINYDGKSRQFPDTRTALETLQSESEGKTTSLNYQAKVIREQATLRLNPFLDKQQNDIKFSHVHDGTCLIIDGGPGTGKTTTLIQRLKLLINEYDLTDYRINYDGCSLTDRQIELVSDSQRNWLFFSPNNLMRKYLRANMVYEGLSDVEKKTVVWNQYLPQIAKTYYYFEGKNGSQFTFDTQYSSIFEDKTGLDPVKSFSKYYYRKLNSIFSSAATVDSQKFSKLKYRVMAISKLCSEMKAINNVKDALYAFSVLQEYSEKHESQLGLSVKQVTDEYENLSKLLVNYFLIEFKSNSEIWSQISRLAELWNSRKGSENDNSSSRFAIENTISSILKQVVIKVAISQFGEPLHLDDKGKALYKIVGKQIKHDRLKELGEYAAYRNYVRTIIQSPETLLFDKILPWYKNYRAHIYKEKDYSIFKEQSINYIVRDHNNQIITLPEMAILVGFINNVVRDLLKQNRTRFEESHHLFITAYKCCCIPVIGIDEATDYSLIDYYAIASLRDYRVNSVSLCGDLMQCMRHDGITDWSILHDPLLFDKLDVKQLTVSYRQSPELMKLADKLYEVTVGKPSPYTCNLEASNDTPKPLWYDSQDIIARAAWISDRIIDIKKAYSTLPSIAIFAKDHISAQSLEKLLLGNRALKQANISVLDCTNTEFVLEQTNTVRIFEIDKVKGMEFDAVFFYDIDTVDVDKEAINRFLYVGLSRAAFFIAVTTSGKNSQLSEILRSCFNQDDNWDPLRADRVIVGIDLGEAATKVCIGTNNENRQYHKLLDFKSENNPYCLPTEVHLCSDWTLKYGSVPQLEESKSVISSMKNFKSAISSEDNKWEYILPRSYVAIWYISYILFSVKEQYDARIQIQFGIKADKKTFAERKKKATSLILSALRLVDEVFEGDFLKFKNASVQELQVNTVEVPYSEALKNDKSIYILPESYSSIFMLSQCISFESGIHLHVDIGHTTSQLTFFEISNDTPFVYNTLNVSTGVNSRTGNELSPVHVVNIRAKIQDASNRAYLCLKYLSDNNSISFRSGKLSKKRLRKSVSFWGGGALDSHWYPDGIHRTLSPFPGLGIGKILDVSGINLIDYSKIQEQICLFTVAIGLSYQIEGDSIPFGGFDLFEIPVNPPKSVTPSFPPAKEKNDQQRSGYSGRKNSISSDLEYRKILASYQQPRIQKMTPEGYEHGLTEY